MPVFPILSKWQRLPWARQDKWWLLLGGRRIGKSVDCYLRGVDCGLHGKTASWFCVDKTLADENWQDICDFTAPWASRQNRHAEGVIWFESSDYGKGIFKRKSGFNKFAGRSGTSNLLIFDEFQLVSRKLFSRSLPSILTTRGHVASSLTPPETPEEYHQSLWLKEIIDSADAWGVPQDPRARRWYVTKKKTEPQDIAFVYMITDVNNGAADPAILKFYEENIQYDQVDGYSQKGTDKTWDAYVKQAIDSLDSDRYDLAEDYDREYNLRWGLDTSGVIYSNVADGVTRSAAHVYDPDSPVYWFVDRGEGQGYHVMLLANHIQIGTRQVKNRYDLSMPPIDVPIYAYRIFDEISTKYVISESEMLNRTLELSAKSHYKLPVLVIYDVRAPGYRSAIRDIGLNPSARNVPIEDGIRKIRRLITRNQLQINPRCARLWQNLTSYSRDAKGYPIDDMDNDAADALRYGVWIVDVMSGQISDTAADSRELVTEIDSQMEKVTTDQELERAGGMMLYF